MFRGRLSLQVMVCVSVVTFVAFSAFVYFELRAQERQMLQKAMRMSELLAETMQARLVEVMVEEERHKLPEIIARYAGLEEVEDVSIFDVDTGEILITDSESRRGQSISERRRLLLEHGEGKSTLVTEDGRHLLCVVKEIPNDPECHRCHDPKKPVIAALSLDMSVDDAYAEIARSRSRVIRFALVTVMAISVVVWFLIRHFIQMPIQELVGTIRRVKEGDLEAEAYIEGRGEFDELSSSFNSMVVRLRNEIGFLEAFYETATEFRETLDLDRRAHIAVRGIIRGLKFDRAVLLLVNDETGKLEGKAGLGVPQRIVESVQIPVDEEHGILARTVLEARPFRIEGGEEDFPLPIQRVVHCWEYHGCDQTECPAYGAMDTRCWLLSGTMCYDRRQRSLRQKMEICAQCPVMRETYGENALLVLLMFGSKSFVTVPLMAQDRAIGVLVADNLHSNRPISEEDMRGLSFFAAHVGISIENAKLYRRLEDRIEAADEELRQKIEALTEMQNFNERILQNMRNGLITVDVDGTVGYFNAAAETILGMSAEEARGRTIGEVCPEIERLVRRAQDCPEGEPEEAVPYHEVTVETHDGRSVPLEVAVSPLDTEGGVTSGFVVIFTDLTARKEMEEQVRRADKLATLGHLAAGIAHEIRNPLAGISGAVQILKEDTPRDDPLWDVFDEIVQKIDALELSLRSFLQFARPAPLQLSPTDVNELVQSVVFLVRNQADARNVEIVEDYADDLPMMMLDSEQIQQVVLNIALNALQAIEGGRGRITFRTYFDKEAGEVVIEVSDTGVGIPPDKLEQIFDPYFTTKSDGTGLGLSIAQRIVEEHGGSISLSSEVGKGTTCRIGLGYAEDDDLGRG